MVALGDVLQFPQEANLINTRKMLIKAKVRAVVKVIPRQNTLNYEV